MESARQNNSLSPANNFPYVKHQTPARNRQRVADPHLSYADNLYANQSPSHQQTFTNVFTQAPHTRHGAVRSSSISPLPSSRTPPSVPFQRAITGTNNGLLQLKDKPKGQSERAAKYQEKLQKQQLAQLIYAGDECLDPASTRSRLQQKIKINRQQKRLIDRQQLPPDLQGRSLNDRFSPQMFELNSSLQHFSAEPQFMNMNKVYPTQRHPFEISSAEVLAKPKKNANGAPSSHGNATNKRKPKAARSKKQRQRDKRQRQQQSKNRKSDKTKKPKSQSEGRANGKQQDQSAMMIEGEMNSATERRHSSGIEMNGSAGISIFPATTSTQITSPNTNLPLDEVPLLSVQPGADISLVSDSPNHSWFCSSPRNEGGLGAAPHLVDERLTLRGDDGQPMTTLVTDSDDEDGEHSPKEYQRLPHSPGERKPLLEHQYRNFSTFEREEDEKVIADNHTDSPHSSATSSPTSSPKQSSGGLPPPPEETSLSKDPMDLLEIEKGIVEQTSSDKRVCPVDRTPQEVRNELAKLMESHQQLEDLGKTLPDLPAWELSPHDESTVDLGNKDVATEPHPSKSTSRKKNSLKKSKTKKKSKSEKLAEAEAQKAAEKKRANKRRKKREARARKKQRLEEEKRAADADAVRKRIADSVAAAVAAAQEDSDSVVESSSHSESEEETDDVPMDDVEEQDDDESENIDEQVEEVEIVSNPEMSPRKTKRARRRRRKKSNFNENETKSEDTSSLAPTVSSTNEIVEEEVETAAPSNQISLEPVSNSDPTYTLVKSKKSRRKKREMKLGNRKSKRGHAIETYSIVRTLPVDSPPTTTSTITAAVKPPLPSTQSTNNKPIIRRPQPVVPSSNSPSTATRKPIVQRTPHPKPNPVPSTTTQSTEVLKPIQRNSTSSPSMNEPTQTTTSTSTSTPPRQVLLTSPVETEQEKPVASDSALPSVDLPSHQSSENHPATLSPSFLQPQPISATMNFAPFAWSSNSFNKPVVSEPSSTTDDSHPSRTERRHHEQVGRPTKPPVTGLRSFFEAKQANASSSSLTEAVDSFHFESVPTTKSAGTSTEDRSVPDTRSAPTVAVEQATNTSSTTTHAQSVPYQPIIQHQHHHHHQQQQQHIPTAPLVSLPTLPNTMPQPDMFSTMPPASQMFTPMFPYPFPMYATQPQPNMDILNHPDTFAAIAAVTGEMAPPPFLMPMPVFLPPNFQAPLGTLPSIVPPLPMMTTPLNTLPQVVMNNHDVFSSAVHGNTGAGVMFQQHTGLPNNGDDAINEVEDCLTDEHGDMSVSDQVTTTATTCSQEDEDDVKDCEDLTMQDGKCRRDEDGVIRGTLDLSQMSKSPVGSEHDEMPDLANHSHEGSEHFEDVKNGEDMHGQRPGQERVVMNLGRKFPTTIFDNAGIVIQGGDNLDIQNLLRLTQN